LIPGIAVDGQKVLTYREAILQEKLPASAVIIGGGAIGVEFATVWNSYGCKVTVVEMLPTLVPREDEELGVELGRRFGRAGIVVKTGTKVEGVDASGDGVKVKINGPAGAETLLAEQTLVAIGFKPNSENLGLEALGVKVERGFIQVDERMQTNVPGVWAIGDVTGKFMLAHVASAQGIVCAESMANHPTVKLDYAAMPAATYSHPQVASFGLTEKQAREMYGEIKVGRFPLAANGKAAIEGETQGMIKVIIEPRFNEILGVHIHGLHATDMISEAVLAMNLEATAEEITFTVHPHPTIAEIIPEAFHAALGKAIHAL
jgi:dihydrolipoamide dehydrogenase